MRIHKIIRDSLTGRDNKTFDGGRILWIVGGLAFIAYGGWEVFLTNHFPAQDFGIGFGSILGGGGVGIGFKAKAEPNGVTENAQ
jgi:hypothetical protein